MQPGALEKHNFDLKKKYDLMTKDETRCEVQGMENNPDYLVVAFGTEARISKGTIKLAAAEGIKAGLFRPITVWPFPYAKGQMLDVVKIAVEDASKIEFYGRPGGGVPTAEELLKFIKGKVK
jgi:2-oxoglutarate ferredoxin oxidoreductase subunit alpha